MKLHDTLHSQQVYVHPKLFSKLTQYDALPSFRDRSKLSARCAFLFGLSIFRDC